MSNPQVQRIYYTPPDEHQEEVISVEVVGGPKRYMRIWPRRREVGIEWGWVLSATSRLVFDADDEGDDL